MRAVLVQGTRMKYDIDIKVCLNPSDRSQLTNVTFQACDVTLKKWEAGIAGSCEFLKTNCYAPYDIDVTGILVLVPCTCTLVLKKLRLILVL